MIAEFQGFQDRFRYKGDLMAAYEEKSNFLSINLFSKSEWKGWPMVGKLYSTLEGFGKGIQVT